MSHAATAGTIVLKNSGVQPCLHWSWWLGPRRCAAKPENAGWIPAAGAAFQAEVKGENSGVSRFRRTLKIPCVVERNPEPTATAPPHSKGILGVSDRTINPSALRDSWQGELSASRLVMAMRHWSGLACVPSVERASWWQNRERSLKLNHSSFSSRCSSEVQEGRGPTAAGQLSSSVASAVWRHVHAQWKLCVLLTSCRSYQLR